jgi:hypothetical protein
MIPETPSHHPAHRRRPVCVEHCEIFYDGEVVQCGGIAVTVILEAKESCELCIVC